MKNIILSIFITLQCSFYLQANNFESLFSSHYKGMSVLVTGGCGFIGSHLVEKLVECGAYVTILDNLNSQNEESFQAIKNNATFIDGDITDFKTCLHATKDKNIIFHLAAFVSVPASMENPLECQTINVIGTQNMLEAARINNVKRFVFSSTCATYGEASGECLESNTPAPTSVYGFSKLIGEMYCKEYAQLFDMETVALRYFNVYGARQNPYGSYAGVIAKFSYNMEHDLPLTIFGDGMQTRDYVPVATIVEANLLFGICNKKYTHGEIFNIATGKSITLLELIDELKKIYIDYQQDILFMPARPGDVKHVAANCTKYITFRNALINESMLGK